MECLPSRGLNVARASGERPLKRFKKWSLLKKQLKDYKNKHSLFCHHDNRPLRGTSLQKLHAFMAAKTPPFASKAADWSGRILTS